MAEDRLLARLQQDFQQQTSSLQDPESVEKLGKLLRQEFAAQINDLEQSLETINEEVLSTVEELNRFRAAELVKYVLHTQQDPSFILTKTEKKAAPKLKKKLAMNCDISTPEPAAPMSEDFRQKVRVVVGNTSQLLGPEDKGSDPFTHKWMVYVRGGRDCPRIDKYIQKVELTLDPSYSPHHVITLSKPPFNLTRRGWGEFPVRVLLHFHDTRNRPFEIIHQLRLTNKLLDYQLCNGETTADVNLIISEVLQQPTAVKRKLSREKNTTELRPSKMVRTEMADMKHVPDLSSLPLFDNEDPVEPSPGGMAGDKPPEPQALRPLKVEEPEKANGLPQLLPVIPEQKFKARAANMVQLVRPPAPSAIRPPAAALKSPNGVFLIRTLTSGAKFLTLDPKSLSLAQPATQLKIEPVRLAQPLSHLKLDPSALRFAQPGTPIKLDPSTFRLAQPGVRLKLAPTTIRLAQSGTQVKRDPSAIRLAHPAGTQLKPTTIRLGQPTFQLRIDPSSLRLAQTKPPVLDTIKLAQPSSPQPRIKTEPPASAAASPPKVQLVKQEPTYNVIQLESGMVALRPSSSPQCLLKPPSIPAKPHLIHRPLSIVKKEPPPLTAAPLMPNKVCYPEPIWDAKTLEQKLQKLRSRRFGDTDALLTRLAELHPLCGQDLDVALHPYSAPSPQRFLNWKLWRRRAAEWQRARAIRLALLQCDQTDVKLSTKQVMLWCRRFGFTPLNPSPSPAIDFSSVCTLTEAGALPVPAEHQPDREDEEVDVESVEQVLAPRPAPCSAAPSIILPPQCPAALEFVRDCCSQIGVVLHPEEVVPGIAAPVAEEILLQASCRFASQLLQASFSKTFQRSYNSRLESVGAISKLDVLHGAQTLEVGELLTNCGLGAKTDTGVMLRPL